MLYLVGLGLGDARDITVKGLEAVRGAERAYLEAYTSILTVGKEELVRPVHACGVQLYIASKKVPLAALDYSRMKYRCYNDMCFPGKCVPPSPPPPRK